MPLTVWLRKGEKACREKVYIALKDVFNLYWQSSSDLKHKGNLVSLQVQKLHFGIGANTKQAGTSFGKKTAQKLDRIENNPLYVIINPLTIYWELLP